MFTYKERPLTICKKFSVCILVSMYLPQINGVYPLRLDVKLVGKVIIGWKINAIKVILMDRKWKPMLFKAIVTQVLLYGVQVWGCTISLNPWNEIEKIQNMFSRRQLGGKWTTSYQVMLLEISVWPIEILTLYQVYRYITKVKNMLTLITTFCVGILDINPKRIKRKTFSHLVGSWHKKMV